jgi:tetratricopeptide (TPR) repeat protein
MARRINTKFVVTLALVLAVVVGGVVIFGARLYFRSRDPKYLMSKAEEAEKMGNERIALQFYSQAMGRSLEAHAPGTAELCMKVGDLAMKLSDEEKDRTEAQRLYSAARNAWESALGEDKRFLPARERLVKEVYDFATASGQASNWTTLLDNVQKLIELSPNNATAYVYRGQARLQLLLSGAQGGAAIDDTVAAIQADLTKAMKLDPKNSKPVILNALLLWSVEAPRATNNNQAKEATKLQDQAVGMLQAYLKANPNDPAATIALVPYLSQRHQEADAVKMVETAYGAHPGNDRLADILALIYQGTDAAKAEKVLKEAIAASPDDTEEYLQLASFYGRTGQRAQAIAAYKEMLEHPKPGGGITLYENDGWEAEAKYQIGWLYMDVAEAEGAGTAQGKTDLGTAAEYIERFRATAKSDTGRQSILDGRLQLLHDNVASAINYLKRAEANLGGGAPTAGKQVPWMEAKMLLVKAYEREKEWGLALQPLDQVLTNSPNNLRAILERAVLLNREALYDQALSAVEPVLASKLPPAVQTEVLRIKAESLYGLGNREEADKIMASLNSTGATLELARSHLIAGEQEQALDELNLVFEKDPNNLPALGLAILANIQLDRKPAAQKLVDQALAKYPDNAQLQMLRASMTKRDGDPVTVQKEIINSITDEFSRSMAFAQLYAKTGEHDKELESLQAAEMTLENDPAHSQDALTNVVNRAFTLALAMGGQAKDDAAKQKYWDVAKTYVQKAQRYNLDGLSGKMYEGQLTFAQGDQRGGLQVLEQAINARPDYSEGRTILGQEYLAADRPADAAEQFRQAIQQKPDSLVALKTLIYILLNKGDSASAEQAEVYLKQALLFAPHDTQLTDFQDLLAINGAGDMAEAIRVREETLKREPDNIANLRHLAVLYVRAKEPSKAIALLLPLYEKNKEDLGVADTLARLYRETGQTNDALTIYERFLSSKDPDIRFKATLLLGELYQNTGAFDQAVQTYQEAVGMEPAGSDQGERRLADMYFDREDMKSAQGMYEKVLAKETTKDPLVVRRLAETLIRQDKFAEANTLLDTLVFKQSPNDSEGLVLKAFSDLRQNEPKEALRILTDVLAKEPNNLNALHYRAYAQFTSQGDLDQATKDLLTVKDRNPNAINSRLLLARVYRATHHLAESVAEYRDVVALRPDAISARVEYAEFLMSLSQIQRNLLPDNRDDIAYTIRAIDPMKTLQALIADSASRFPNVPTWAILEGNLLALNDRTADAQQLYKQAFTASGGSPQAAGPYLSSLLKTRSYEQVVDLSGQILQQRPTDVETMLRRAAAEAGLNKMDDAAADCGRAIETVVKDASTLMAVVHSVGDILPHEKLLGLLDARVRANPNELTTKLAIGQTLITAGQPADAVKELSPLLTDAGAQSFRLLTLRSLALAQYEAKDFPGAEAHWKELLKSTPNDLESLNNLSFLLADDEKRPQDGLLYAEQAVKVLQNSDASSTFVNNGNVYDTYGWVKYLCGDVDGAIHELRRATESSPLPITYLHLAKAYVKAGRKADAGKALDDGIALATEQKDSEGTELQSMKRELAR